MNLSSLTRGQFLRSLLFVPIAAKAVLSGESEAAPSDKPVKGFIEIWDCETVGREPYMVSRRPMTPDEIADVPSIPMELHYDTVAADEIEAFKNSHSVKFLDHERPGIDWAKGCDHYDKTCQINLMTIGDNVKVISDHDRVIPLHLLEDPVRGAKRFKA